jgi:hypothetical protein
MNKIRYGELTRDNTNAIIDKAKAKADGVYSFRGILYRVKNGKVPFYACKSVIYGASGSLVYAMAGYDSEKMARVQLKQLI